MTDGPFWDEYELADGVVVANDRAYQVLVDVANKFHELHELAVANRALELMAKSRNCSGACKVPCWAYSGGSECIQAHKHEAREQPEREAGKKSEEGAE